MYSPEAIRQAVVRFNNGPRKTRIFNHSINARGHCRTRYMSSWAAEIDQLCYQRDVLIVQSAGNLPIDGAAPYVGIREHLAAGRDYPWYLVRCTRSQDGTEGIADLRCDLPGCACA